MRAVTLIPILALLAGCSAREYVPEPAKPEQLIEITSEASAAFEGEWNGGGGGTLRVRSFGIDSDLFELDFHEVSHELSERRLARRTGAMLTILPHRPWGLRPMGFDYAFRPGTAIVQTKVDNWPCLVMTGMMEDHLRLAHAIGGSKTVVPLYPYCFWKQRSFHPDESLPRDDPPSPLRYTCEPMAGQLGAIIVEHTHARRLAKRLHDCWTDAFAAADDDAPRVVANLHVGAWRQPVTIQRARARQVTGVTIPDDMPALPTHKVAARVALSLDVPASLPLHVMLCHGWLARMHVIERDSNGYKMRYWIYRRVGSVAPRLVIEHHADIYLWSARSGRRRRSKK